jgi:uncharacterized protein YegL
MVSGQELGMMNAKDGRISAIRATCVLGLVLVATMAVRLLPARAQPEPTACVAHPSKIAAPSEIALGDTIRVTLTLTADCPPEVAPIDVALVLDVSGSMENERKLENAKVAADTFVDAMDLALSRVGLVTFNHRAGIRVPLVGGAEVRRIHSAIEGLIAGGQTNISAAIDIAHQMLRDADRGDHQAMVVLTDGFNTVSGAEPVPDAAARVKGDGITVATFCAGGQCDPGLLPAASLPELYFDVPDTTRLPELYRDLAGALQVNTVTTLTIRDEIPDNMRYIDGSAAPVPARVGRAPGAYLEWDFAGGIPSGGISYRLEPLELGVHPTNVVATGMFTDRRGRGGEAVFPVPQVKVNPPPCIPQSLDVYFLIDDSNCLYGAVLNGRPSLEAIRMGAERVLDQLRLGRDRGAVIAFGDTAVLLQPLTTDRQAILDAVMKVAMRDDAARLDLAYAKTRRELGGPLFRSTAQVATVFVTDGPMMPSLDMADQQARLLRQLGVVNYGIGIGDLAQHALLRSVCEPGGYYECDFGGDIITPYTRIGATVAAFGGICLPLDRLTPGPRPTATRVATTTPLPAPAHSVYLPRNVRQ